MESRALTTVAPLPWRAMFDDMKGAGVSYNWQAKALGITRVFSTLWPALNLVTRSVRQSSRCIVRYAGKTYRTSAAALTIFR